MAASHSDRINGPAAATSSSSASASRGHNLPLLSSLQISLWPVIHQEGIQRKGFGEDHVADLVATHGDAVVMDGFTGASSQLGVLHVNVHLGIDTSDGAMDDGTVLEFNRNRLIADLHQESKKSNMMIKGRPVVPDELHDWGLTTPLRSYHRDFCNIDLNSLC